MERSYLEWIYIGPVLLLLATNTFFLLSIFYVVVTKLRSTGAMQLYNSTSEHEYIPHMYSDVQ